jgi:hypothetical protein
VEDRSGNVMSIAYANSEPSPAGGGLEAWVTHIHYTGFRTGSSDTPGNRTVTFAYETRPDPITQNLAGIQLATTQRPLADGLALRG